MAIKNQTATVLNSVTHAGKTIYLNNKELLTEVKLSKEKGKMSSVLAKQLQLLCSKYAKKGSFVNYSYNEDMQAYAMMMLVRTWQSFDPEKGSNAFAFFTQCIKNSFIQYLNHERRHRDVRDLLLIDQGLNPSYGFDSDGERTGGPAIEDERDFDHIRSAAEALSRVKYDDSPIVRDNSGIEVVEQVDIPEEPADSGELV